MTHASELTITLKGDDSSFKQKFLCYEDSQLTPSDTHIAQCIEECKAQYKGNVESIKVSIKLLLE